MIKYETMMNKQKLYKNLDLISLKKLFLLMLYTFFLT